MKLDRNMEKKFELMSCVHVVSEPGDGTRYDYAFIKDGPDEYHFVSVGNNFNYPQRLNYYEVINAEDKDIIDIAKLYNCNPHTVMECIRTMKEDPHR